MAWAPLSPMSALSTLRRGHTRDRRLVSTRRHGEYDGGQRVPSVRRTYLRVSRPGQLLRAAAIVAAPAAPTRVPSRLVAASANPPNPRAGTVKRALASRAVDASLQGRAYELEHGAVLGQPAEHVLNGERLRCRRRGGRVTVDGGHGVRWCGAGSIPKGCVVPLRAPVCAVLLCGSSFQSQRCQTSVITAPTARASRCAQDCPSISSSALSLLTDPLHRSRA